MMIQPRGELKTVVCMNNLNGLNLVAFTLEPYFQDKDKDKDKGVTLFGVNLTV